MGTKKYISFERFVGSLYAKLRRKNDIGQPFFMYDSLYFRIEITKIDNICHAELNLFQKAKLFYYYSQPFTLMVILESVRYNLESVATLNLDHMKETK